MIVMKDWHVTVPPADRMIAYEKDHLTRRLEIVSDVPPEWVSKLDTLTPRGEKNIIDLACSGNVLSVDLTREMLSVDGPYVCQLRCVNEDKVRHTNTFTLHVSGSINATDAFPDPLPSEFLQIEQRVTELANTATHPPQIGENGNWLVWSDGGYMDSGVSARGESPYIGSNGNWWVGESDTGVSAAGGAGYQIGDGLKVEGGVLSVDTADAVEQDNSKPVTSAAVHAEIGNIEVLLAAL